MISSLAYAWDDTIFVSEDRRLQGNEVHRRTESSTLEPLKQNLSTREAEAAAKIAGRMNAAAISQEQIDSLYAERKALLDKKHFAGQFSAEDRRRLALIRWKIDCVIEAKHGAQMDKLAEAIKSYRKIAQDIFDLKEGLAEATMNKREKRGHGKVQLTR